VIYVVFTRSKTKQLSKIVFNPCKIFFKNFLEHTCAIPNRFFLSFRFFFFPFVSFLEGLFGSLVTVLSMKHDGRGRRGGHTTSVTTRQSVDGRPLSAERERFPSGDLLRLVLNQKVPVEKAMLQGRLIFACADWKTPVKTYFKSLSGLGILALDQSKKPMCKIR